MVLGGLTLGTLAVVAGVLAATLSFVLCGSPESSCDEGAAYWFTVFLSVPIGLAAAVAFGMAGWRARHLVHGTGTWRELALPLGVGIASIGSWFAGVYGLAWLFPA